MMNRIIEDWLPHFFKIKTRIVQTGESFPEDSSADSTFRLSFKSNRNPFFSSFLLEKLEAENEGLQSFNLHLRLAQQRLADQNLELRLLNDSTERASKLAEEVSARTEKRYRSILNVMPHIAWATDQSGNVSFINDRWFEYTGLDRSQSISSSWGITVHPDDITATATSFLNIMAGNIGGEFEARTRRSDGVYRWFITRMQPIHDEKGQALFWIGTATDIDDMIRNQQKNNDLLNMASHEMKTPLSSIKAAIQLLNEQKGELSPELRFNLINRASNSIDKVVYQVENLLKVGSLGQEHQHIKRSVFRIVDLLEDYCSELKLAGNFTIRYTGDTSLMVYADSKKIEQVLVNMISNAMKYAPDSRVIIISMEALETTVRIGVIDQGPGIEPKLIDRLFDPYFQVNSEGRKGSGFDQGIGLGLYISSCLIELHGGEIKVDSIEGKGTSFWFNLPRA